VVGHSAGEVASAWAAGLLTLEEAVQVVYYRSAEQQKLAGCGRLLAVGLGQNEALEFLAQHGLEEELEIACVNSPQSTVLAGSEATLERAKAALPEGTFGAFVPGNIAFHSSRVEPILPEIRRRLAFLDDPARALLRPADAALFVSTVTGEEQGQVDARYWCENVRRAVVFEHAVNCIFAEEATAPDLVLEIGPHKTLAGPLLQIVKGMGRETAALPTLKRGGECAAVMTALLGELFTQGVRVEMQGFYDGLGYQLVDLPKHPYIKTRMHEHVPIHKREKWAGAYLAGPVAGSFKAGAYEVEVCDRTFKPMMDHKMGGQEILPGTMYVEMAIEAVGVPCTLTNVEFKSMCKIPRTSAGDISTLVSLVLREAEGNPDMQSFLVRSTPAKARAELLDEPRTYSDHCTGFAIKGSSLLTPDGQLDPDCHLRASSFGLLVPWELRDIGKDGLAKLRAQHTHCLAASREQFYGIVNNEGLSEYGASFQVVSALHGNMVNDTYIGTVRGGACLWCL
jgi:acyl transferase domain-containing protein